jgi:putative SOS response-associated peptidase YedK
MKNYGTLPKNRNAPPGNIKLENLSQLWYHTERVFVSYPVSTLVNSPANDSPACIQPLARLF